MRVLVDECAPKALKQFLAKHGHQCQTVQEVGWSGKQNGDLLALAEPKFEVLVTVDANVSYQQNLQGRSIAIVVVHSSSNRLEHLRQWFPACELALKRIRPGEIVRIGSGV